MIIIQTSHTPLLLEMNLSKFLRWKNPLGVNGLMKSKYEKMYLLILCAQWRFRSSLYPSSLRRVFPVRLQKFATLVIHRLSSEPWTHRVVKPVDLNLKLVQTSPPSSGFSTDHSRDGSSVAVRYSCICGCIYNVCFVILPRHTIGRGIMVSRWTSVCLSVRPSVVRPSIFHFPMIT